MLMNDLESGHPVKSGHLTVETRFLCTSRLPLREAFAC
jgi:hypothetical protein